MESVSHGLRTFVNTNFIFKIFTETCYRANRYQTEHFISVYQLKLERH